MSLKSISYSRKLGYSFGNLGFGVVYQAVVSYLVFYSTVILRLPGAIIGTVVALSVIWDAVTDPVMGFISDNTVLKKFGRRHLYLIIGGLGGGISNYLLWVVNPQISPGLKVLWILISLLLIKTFLTIYATPYTALGAELTSDYDERSSIQGLRTIFFLLGIFIVTFLFMVLFFKATPGFPRGQLNPAAYSKMGFASSIAIIISSLVAYYTTKKLIPYLPKTSDKGTTSAGLMVKVFTDFKIAFKNKNFIFIVMGYLFTNIVSALASSLGLHVYTFTFGLDSKLIALIIGMQLFACILSQPLWVYISKKIDKKPTIILGLIICVISFAVFLFLVLSRNRLANIPILLIMFSGLLGLGTGGLFSLPLSMIADTIDVEELTTGKRSEGMFYGLQTFSYKITQSIVIFVMGILLEFIKFNPRIMIQSSFTATGLGLILSLGGIFSLILSLLSYSKYNLSRDKILDIQKQLELKKEKE